MTHKKVYLAEVGEVTLVKKRGNRHIRLSVTPKGTIRVSLPLWASYRSALSFAHKNRDWISRQLESSHTLPLRHGDHIGKAHTIVINEVASASGRITPRVTATEITVAVGPTADQELLQTKLRQACERALKQQSLVLLPQRLEKLAQKYGYKYRSVAVRRLTSRWGSCSSRDNIVLSTYLIQLPWHLIDYVLVHELVHTAHKHHQAAFWSELEAKLPATQQLRKELKKYRPTLIAT